MKVVSVAICLIFGLLFLYFGIDLYERGSEFCQSVVCSSLGFLRSVGVILMIVSLVFLLLSFLGVQKILSQPKKN